MSLRSASPRGSWSRSGTTVHTSSAIPCSVRTCAERTESRCSASTPAMVANSPVRSGAATVTVQVTASSGSARTVSVPFSHQRALGRRQRRRRGRRCAVQAQGGPSYEVVHESCLPLAPRGRPGGQRVGPGEGRQQLEHLGGAQRVGHRGDGGRVVEVAPGRVLDEQQVVAHEQPDGGDVVVVEAHPLRGGDTERHARPRCGRPGRALADVVQQRGDEQQVGPVHLADQRGRLHRGLDQVPVDAEPVHGVALRAVPHQVPLRQQAGARARPGRGPPTPAPATARRRAGRRTGAARSPATAGAAAGLSATSRSTELGESGSPARAAAGGHPQHEQRVGARVGLGGEHGLAVVLGQPRAEQPQHRLAAADEPGPLRPGGLQGAAPGHVGGVGDRRRRRCRPRAAARRRRPGRASAATWSCSCSSRRLPGTAGRQVQRVAHVGEPAYGVVDVAVRTVGDPRRGDRAQRHDVAQPAAALLEVGLEVVAQVAGAARRARPTTRAAPAAGAGRPPASRRARWCAAGRPARGRRRPAGRRAGRAAPRGRCWPAAGPRRRCAPSGRGGRRCPRPGTRLVREGGRCRRGRRAASTGRGRCPAPARRGRSRRPRPARPSPASPAGRRTASANTCRSQASVRAASPLRRIADPVPGCRGSASSSRRRAA